MAGLAEMEKQVRNWKVPELKTFLQARGISVSNNNKKKMLFLTVVACEIGRNGYFDGTDQRTGSGCLVGIMGNLSYK